MSQKREFGKYLEQFAEKTRKLSVNLRVLILKIIPKAVEKVHIGMKWITYGVPRSIVAIKPMQNHVKLFFFEGVLLEDPDHLLHGSGARLRFVQVKDLNTERKSLEKLIIEAYDLQKKKKFQKTKF